MTATPINTLVDPKCNVLTITNTGAKDIIGGATGAAGALDVPASWRKSLGGKREEKKPAFSTAIDFVTKAPSGVARA